MYFQIVKVVLWPRDNNEKPRIVDFHKGVVNVITGASKTGKSAVIPIIDYCLGAAKCAIPVGVIRENCAWFGVVIETLEGQKLLARREPGDQQSTGDMFMLEEAPEVKVPDQIEDKNTNVEIVKAMLDRLAGLSNLGFDPQAESSFKYRPGFRDLMAFTFQPQNIVANPDVMFFKADTTEHREKLKTIFPYVLGAVNPKILQARWELDRILRVLRQKEAELRARENATTTWRLEAQAWLRQAVDLGIIPPNKPLPTDWPDIVDWLKAVANTNSRQATPSLSGIDATLSRLETLRKEESNVALTLSEHRQRLSEIRRLLESSDAYRDAILIKRDRLALAKWIKDLQVNTNDPLVALGDNGRNKLYALCESLEGIEVQLQSHPSFSDTLDKELLKQRAATETIVEQLLSVRREIAVLERDSEAARNEAYRLESVERFLGRIEQALRLYEETDESSQLRDEVSALQERVKELQGIIAETAIWNKTQNALSRIQNITSRLIPKLDAEWPEAPIKLVIPELTVKVIRGNRDDYLWEIGSGANWLAYHVALTLALQHFFLAEAHHPVPGLLIYDQPSQVYFPKRAAREDHEADPSWKDEDVAAVRKVFALLGEEVVAAQGRLQIIVLDHADEGVWDGLAGIQRSEEWRNEQKLVPVDWIED